MYKQIRIAAAAASLVIAAGCAHAGASAEQKAYDAALVATSAAADKAKSVNGEWRDIRWKKSKINLMKKAATAAKAGDFAKAMSLLKEAKFRAEMGYQQAMEQKNAGPHH